VRNNIVLISICDGQRFGIARFVVDVDELEEALIHEVNN
jgi:hypothetical protein